MALFKSQVITQASGSIGGVTFTRTRSGMTLRARSMPVNPNTPYQQAVRSAQSSISQAWQTSLTDDQRAAWTNYALNVSRRNKLGDAIILTGHQMFVRCNAPRLQAGLAAVLDGPTDYTLGDPPTEIFVDTEPAEPNELLVQWDSTGVPADTRALLYLSRPMSRTRNFFKGPYRFNSENDATSGVVSAAVALLPSPIDVGGRIFARIRFSYPDGRLSDAVEASGVATVPIPGTTPED